MTRWIWIRRGAIPGITYAITSGQYPAGNAIAIGGGAKKIRHSAVWIGARGNSDMDAMNQQMMRTLACYTTGKSRPRCVIPTWEVQKRPTLNRSQDRGGARAECPLSGRACNRLLADELGHRATNPATRQVPHGRTGRVCVHPHAPTSVQVERVDAIDAPITLRLRHHPLRRLCKDKE